MKTYKTNYSVAVNWCNNALILCNNITEIDPSVYDNLRFELFDEEDGTQRDIYQWFITDCTDDDVEYLEKHLDCFSLIQTFWISISFALTISVQVGTMWNGKLQMNWQRENWEKRSNNNNLCTRLFVGAKVQII